jgi:SAM-dependent methyltransferase
MAAVARSRTASAATSKTVKANAAKADRRITAAAAAAEHRSFQDAHIGSGVPQDPLRLPLRSEANASGCYHCPTATCFCELFADALADASAAVALKRLVEVAGNNALCAKSLNPCFVARLAHLLDVRSDDTFYDLGCGNGSILFQMAMLTGARCVGVEISKHNAEVARRTWAALRPALEDAVGHSVGDVEIITGDLAELIMTPEFEGRRPCKILTSNLLLPRSLTHFMSERFRALPRGSRVACFDDLYPHGRACARTRDPEAFELFHMQDCVWPPMAVEWCSAEGSFYVHTRV